MPLIREAVLAACDANDGVADGILTDPRTCTWDPAELLRLLGESAPQRGLPIAGAGRNRAARVRAACA